jgi:hypothetical protein
MTKQISISKYFYALGYHHRMCDRDEPPSQSVIDYYLFELDFNPIEEYQKGRKTAERDIVNGLR